MTLGIDAVVFDFDGLMLDTEVPVYEAWRVAFETYGGVPPTLEEWGAIIGTDSDDQELLDLLFATASRPVDLDEMHATRRAHRDALLAAEEVLPGVTAWIDEALDTGLGIAIASSSPDEWVLGHLDRLGLRGHFEHVMCAGDIRPGKPAPDTYLAACAALGVESRRALAVEDSANGITAAKGAGLWCVVVPNAMTKSLDLSAADLRLDSLAQCSLRDAVERVFAGRSECDQG
jgi:HAD superfamily hydrolase (TIGR01509 family)